MARFEEVRFISSLTITDQNQIETFLIRKQVTTELEDQLGAAFPPQPHYSPHLRLDSLRRDKYPTPLQFAEMEKNIPFPKDLP